ncbi:MAG: M24 family metallopeptidase [Pseudomonadota bacterium]|nr:M24 family metallopeptidase [Pseudomonadota bacterium]
MELDRPYALPDCLADLVTAEWPRFSDAEMEARHAAIDALMAKADVKYLLVYGFFWNGPAIPWLTHWPTSAEAALVVAPGEEKTLYIQFHNHVPQATVGATHCRVDWGGPDTMATVIDDFRNRGAGADDRIGVIGPLGMAGVARLKEAFGDVVDMNRAFGALRLVKSDEEVGWMRIGAWYSDRAMQAVDDNLAPGITERELGDLCQRAWVPHGGETVIHFFGSTPMADPNCKVPRQLPSTRPVEAGDIVFCEISGAFRGYSGQVLRSFAVSEDPTPLYRDLYVAAEAAYDGICGVLKEGVTGEEIVAASSAIEDAGFTTCDDLVHGYGGGYLPPIVGSASRPAGPIPDMTLNAGMMIVVQPNVVSQDGKAGVQTGECLLITKDGWESIHKFPTGLRRIG